MLKPCVVVLLLTVIVSVAVPVRADLERDDLMLLGLMFRNRFVPYSEQPDADPAATQIAEQVRRLGRHGDPVELYRAMIKGMAIMYLGRWNEGMEVATMLDMRVPAVVYEPGDAVIVKLAPVYERAEGFERRYSVRVQLMDCKGNAAGEPVLVPVDRLDTASIKAPISADISPGRYTVEYTILPYGNDGETIFTGSRPLYVLDRLKARLDALAEKRETIRSRGLADKNVSTALAASTVDWYIGIYQRGLQEDVPSEYGGRPSFMTHVVEQGGLVTDRLDFANELELAEELAEALVTGKDPLCDRSGDMRLAYTSPADGELVPFRILVPDPFDPGGMYPLVLALHGAGGNENSFMDGFDRRYAQNAQRHGYIAVAVNGRGPYGGYRGKSGQDVTDVLDLVQRVYPIDKTRTYLTGHSMGAGGTVRIGFGNADRFAALAPIAGFGDVSHMAKAKAMPLFIGAGDRDALVPVDRMRRAYKAAQDLGMPQVKYVEKKGADHLSIVAEVMEDVFDWFDSHAK